MYNNKTNLFLRSLHPDRSSLLIGIIFYFLFFIFSFLFFANIYSQEYSADEKKILTYQDTRDLGPNKELLNYLKSSNEKIVTLTLNALANISDSMTVDEIGKILLSDPRTEVRKFSAFALGQIPCGKSVFYLDSSRYKEETPEVVKYIFDALGKVGDKSSLELILSSQYSDPGVNEYVALSIARFAIRGIKSNEAIKYLKELINSNPSKELEEKIAYALFRMRSKELLTPIHEEILKLCNSKNEFSRMWAFTALGYIADTHDIDFVLDKYSSESSWMVKTNILNSFNNYKKADESVLNQKLIECLFSSFDDMNPNVRITGFTVTGLLFSKLNSENKFLQVIKNKLEWYLKPDIAVDWRDIGEAINSYGMIFKDSVKNILLQKYSETPGYDIKPFIVGAFKYFVNALVWRELTDTISADVQRYNIIFKTPDGDMIQSKELGKIYIAYVGMLSELYKKADDTTKANIRILISAFTDSKEPVIVDECITFINSDTLESGKFNFMQEFFVMDYSELTYPKDKEVMMLYINEIGELKFKKGLDILKKNLNSPDYDICKASAVALEKITGKKFKFKTKPRTDFDWEFIKSLSKKTAVIKTEYGEIKIKFYPEAAPFSVQNFVKLAQKKFYDGLEFPRVVPNFVIQGGDPLNNGWGGCGYSIRSEFSPLYYERGLVGIASDGKDTEGSQYFIMHSPHYHLDGRYTIIGEVTEGMDVVDKNQVGDKALEILIIEY